MRAGEALLLGVLFVVCGLTAHWVLQSVSSLLVAIVGLMLVLYAVYLLVSRKRA